MKSKVRPLGILLAVFALVGAACGGSSSQSPSGSGGGSAAPTEGGVVEVRWFCCLGGGGVPGQIETEDKAVADFNASHPNIKIVREVVAYQGARDALSTEIAGDNAPDIVGPVGVGGSEAFHGEWLDLAELIASNNYDVTQFAEGTVDFYNVGGEGQIGLPFAVYPTILFYQKEMFAEAGLQEPPHTYGDQYTMPDGSKVDWDYDTIDQIAKLLTVDVNGNNATESGFDATKIEQFGFEPYRDDIRGLGANFGAGSIVGSDGKTVEFPDAWEAGWRWYYKSMWDDHTVMQGALFDSDDYNPEGYPFCTSLVAMEVNYLWSTYCLAGAGEHWNVAAVPAYNGTTTAPLNADTFRILKDSKHPNEAFEVLTYLLGDASGDLLQAYGGFPARSSQQDAFFAGLDTTYPFDVDWQVAKDSLPFADNPNWEAYMPAYNETLDRLNTFGTKLRSDGNLDLDGEINTLKSDIQAIWDRQ
jgi:multiple sugar transport system substrate-binding protein